MIDEKNIISATEGSRIQAAGVNNLSSILQGGPINGYSGTNSVSSNNYYIGSGETPGVGQPYKDGDKVTLKAQNGEEFSATVDLSQPGGNVKVDDYEGYNEANYDPNNLEPKTALIAAPDVAFEQTANFMIGADNFLAWGNSLIGNEEGKQYYLDRAAECEAQENKVHEYFKSFAPDKELYELKVKQGMLIVDMAMIASLAKDGVVLTVKGIKFLKAVKVTGKMPKSIKELRDIIMRCFIKTKGGSNPELSRIDYLRNKYGKLTSEQINNRINLRGAVNDEIDRLYKSGISKKELGPAVAGVLDTKTGKYYFGINNIKGKVPTELHPIIKERIDNMPLETYNSYEKWTLGAGSHAEVYALNEAMLANPNAKLEDFMVYVVRSGKKLKPRGLPMPRCPHCEHITDGASYFPEVLKYGK